ncbi:MAG TPA: dienelactone hydrolase family protein [Candidatus Cybelea sp.]|nr:dienelactone hydrolase family protein [Candidatus Cybelea sp.]
MIDLKTTSRRISLRHAPARRDVLTGLAGLSLAAILADPVRVAQAAASLTTVTIKTPSGRSISGALALPATTPAGAVMIVHEWWGLNDQIKSVAAELASTGFVALAVDLYAGKVASDPTTAQSLMGALKPEQATETVTGWIDHLYGMKEVSGKVATLGFCFGGGWSLNASLAHPVDATVIYYGLCNQSADQLKPLKGPVLGHFAGLDQWITPQMVNGFEAALKTDGKTAEIYRYADANHAFANPTGQNYEKEDARLAWDRTVAFLRKTIA